MVLQRHTKWVVIFEIYAAAKPEVGRQQIRGWYLFEEPI